MENRSGLLAALLAGVVIGATTTLLVTTKTGSEVRSDIKTKSDEIYNKLKDVSVDGIKEKIASYLCKEEEEIKEEIKEELEKEGSL